MSNSKDSGRFKFVDLFAGIGGFRKAFESVGGTCVFSSEIDRFAQLTYQANFCREHEFVEDIREVDSRHIPVHDFLLAGFPCQPFSLAGVSKKNSLGLSSGFQCETQGTLFFDIARILDQCRPKAFLLENVKNLVSHDQGKTFKTIIRTLTKEVGYSVDVRIINGKSFVPQNRERIFIAGFKESSDFSFDSLVIPDADSGPRLGTILHPEDGSEEKEEPFTEGLKAKVSEKYTLSDHLWDYLQGYAEKHRAKGNGFGFGLFNSDDVARTLSARYHKDGSEILISQGKKNPRRLTPRECSRLMGFDKGNKSDFKIPVSDAQAYRQFGNSVVVPVIEDIAKHMLKFID